MEHENNMWLRRLFLKKMQRWAEGPTLRQVTRNLVWLGADSVFRLLVAFFVGAWVARSLGPSQFGLLNYAVAFSAPFGALVSLGMNGLLVRDLVRYPEQEGELLGTSIGLKLAGALAGSVFCVVAMAVLPKSESRSLILIAITMGGSLLQVGDVLELWFQSRGVARVPAWIRSGASLVANAGKLLLILSHGPLWSFALANAAELALALVVCVVVYLRSRREGGPWRWSSRHAVRLLAEAWPLAGAGMAIQVQAYFDQVLLGGMRSVTEVGVYAAALRLVTVFGFVPMVVANAAAPEIARAHRDDPLLYLRRMRDVYRAMLIFGLLSVLPLLLFPHAITGLVFGATFAGVVVLLPAMALRVLLTNLGVARGIFIANEGLTLHALGTAAGGAVVNVVLNLLLIPRMGAMGCVLVSLASFTASTIVFEFFNKRARLNLRLMAAAIGLAPLLPAETK